MVNSGGQADTQQREDVNDDGISLGTENLLNKESYWKAKTANAGVPQHLKGTKGDETIEGGDENDIIDGKGGVDTLTGGGGSNTFIIGTNGSGYTTITDFSPSDDKVKILYDDGNTAMTEVERSEDLLTKKGEDTEDGVVFRLDPDTTFILQDITLAELRVDDFSWAPYVDIA